MSGADLTRAVLVWADLRGVDLRNATLPRDPNACFDDRTRWPAGYEPGAPDCGDVATGRSGAISDRYFTSLLVGDPANGAEGIGNPNDDPGRGIPER